MNLRKLMAGTLAVTMVAGSSMTILAADGDPVQTATGTGTSFEHVDKEIIDVTLPTEGAVKNVFNYYVDPERAINGAGTLTDGKKVTPNDDGVYFAHPGAEAVPDKNATVTAFSIGGKTAADTDVTVTVPNMTTATSLVYDLAEGKWFNAADTSEEVTVTITPSTVTPADSDTITIDPYVAGTPAGDATFTSSSEAVKFEGKNSVNVDVSVKAVVTPTAGGKDIALVADEEALAAATGPALLMKLKVGSESKAIATGDDGTTAKAVIAGKPNNFAITADSGKFVYGIRTNTDTTNGGTALEDWGTTTVQLVGKTNTKDIPEGTNAMTAPAIALTWSVAKSEGASEPSEPEIETTPASAISASGTSDILVRLVSGQNASVANITSAKVNGTAVAAANIAVSGSGNVWLKGVASGAGEYKVLIEYSGTTYSATLNK